MIFGHHEPETLAQYHDVSSRAHRAALMADGHLGYVMPIGGVAAYRNRVSVVGVGFDIACGNAAIRTDLERSALGEGAAIERLADAIHDAISFGVGRTNRDAEAPVDHPLFDDPAWEGVPHGAREALRTRARDQLGTVGGGNHYVDVFVDPDERVWVGVHFGSRGFGHSVARGFLALSQGKPWGATAPQQEVLLELDTPLGDAYWHLMQLAGRYAYAGREWVARKVVEILGGAERELVHNHHNFAWKERHPGPEGSHEEWVVVRKGATPAFPGQKSFVGGSMGDISVILEGTSDPDARPLQESALFSTVHGAGRVMSRTRARGKWKKGRPVRPGLVSPEMMRAAVDQWGVTLRGGDLDESPHVYRRLAPVLETQGPTIRVLHELHPVIVCMAPGGVFDPYRD